MPKRVIKSIQRIKSVGRFVDWTADAELPAWRRFNLFYGFNGSGKTTVARILDELGRPTDARPCISQGGVRVVLDDETIVAEGSEALELRDRIFVFSTDFVQSNFKWNDSTANPVYYLGEEQADLAERLATLKEQLANKVIEQTAALAAYGSADNTFQTFKRDKARSIGQALGTARQYNAATFAGDIARDLTPEMKLSDDDRSAHQALIHSAEEYRVLPVSSGSFLPGEAELEEVASIAGIIPESEALRSLHPHERLAGWVQTGAQYHVEHHLDRCLHCFELFTPDGLGRISKLVQDETKRLLTRIAGVREAIDNAGPFLANALSALPQPSDFLPIHREAAGRLIEEVRAGVRTIQASLKDARGLLSTKLNNLGSAVDVPETLNADAARDQIMAVMAAQDQLGAVAEAHNSAIKELERAKNLARDRLKNDMLFDARELYHQQHTTCVERQQEAEVIKAEVARLSREIAAVQDSMKSHQEAATHISTTVTRFLGHGELSVKPIDEGYSICRDGKPVLGPLSEGERTAIAFCYFLVMLSAEGRELEDLIVIVDDPISSLDSGALNYTASLMTTHLQKCGQGVVLTHNINFFHEVKKWLRRMEAGKDQDGTLRWKRAGLFLVSCKKDSAIGHRRSSIERLSKLLREYESEYHYLFFLIGSAAKDKTVSDELSVLLPNAIRKALDTFLAFRHPSSSPIEDKAADLVKDLDSFDKIRLSALLRLIQTESHADSISDSASFCPMTTEEAYEACQNFMYFISVVDEDHFRRMKDICDLGDETALCGGSSKASRSTLRHFAAMKSG